MNSDAGTVRRYDPRKQILKLHSGRLCGDLTLLDLLYLSICSGDIVINVTPGPASTRPPVKDALFEVEVEDGEINAIFPEYMISDTARRYYCTLLNVETGSIKGIYPLGSNNFECDDGDIRLSLVGGVRHETSVDVFTKRGNQSINISPYSTSLLENAIIKCKSDKGNIYVRARFEGTFPRCIICRSLWDITLKRYYSIILALSSLNCGAESKSL